MDTIAAFFNNQFNGPVTMADIILSLVFSGAVALFILLVYRKTFTGVVYNRSMTLCLLLLAMVTAMIIRTINSNLSLSLGMVGALSIVRFRTAVKEPVDTAFMFWAITDGIMCGAGLYLAAIVGSLVLGLVYYLMYLSGVKAKAQYLLVVRYDVSAEAAVSGQLAQIAKKKLKSRVVSDQQIVELTFEIEYSKDTDPLMDTLQGISGVRSVHLVSYANDFGQ